MSPSSLDPAVATPRKDACPPAAIVAALGPGLHELARRESWPVGVKDLADGRYLWINDGLADLLGCDAAAARGRTDAQLVPPALTKTLRAIDVAAGEGAGGGALSSELRFEVGGQMREFSVLRVVAEGGGRRLLCCIWRDLAPQRQREAQLKAALEQIEREQDALRALRRELADQGLRDAATGLYTSAHFEDQLRREVDLSNREHREFALVCVALDPLAPQVQALGARALERIHESMGRMLRGNTRAMDAASRVDDHRFAVLLSGVGLATAHSRMEGLRRQVANQIVVLDGEELRFTVSMGVASFPHTAQSKDEVQQASQSAMVEARRRGGNAVVLAGIRFGPM